MEVIINGAAHEVPFDPAAILLEDFIAYHKEYGKDLDIKLNEILDKIYTGEEEEQTAQRNLDLEDHLDTEGLCWYSFWTKFDLLESRQHPSIIPLLSQYRVLRHLLRNTEDVAADSFPVDIDWNGETWHIADFKINPTSEMSFNEIITSKEIMRQVHSIGAGKWEGMPYLCAVYLRRKGETFTDDLVQDGGERMGLFRKLPLNIAMTVAFFLNICVSIWSKALASFQDEELATPRLK